MDRDGTIVSVTHFVLTYVVVLVRWRLQARVVVAKLVALALVLVRRQNNSERNASQATEAAVGDAHYSIT